MITTVQASHAAMIPADEKKKNPHQAELDVVKTVEQALTTIGFSNYELRLFKTAGSHQYNVRS